jgi:hypothetical protein
MVAGYAQIPNPNWDTTPTCTVDHGDERLGRWVSGASALDDPNLRVDGFEA